MKKNIGPALALYPTPAVVAGVESEGKINWILVAHVGIIGHDRIMLSMYKGHHSNILIKAAGKFSVSLVSEDMLERADYAGIVSGARVDKSAHLQSSVFKLSKDLIDSIHEEGIVAYTS